MKKLILLWVGGEGGEGEEPHFFRKALFYKQTVLLRQRLPPLPHRILWNYWNFWNFWNGLDAKPSKTLEIIEIHSKIELFLRFYKGLALPGFLNLDIYNAWGDIDA